MLGNLDKGFARIPVEASKGAKPRHGQRKVRCIPSQIQRTIAQGLMPGRGVRRRHMPAP